MIEVLDGAGDLLIRYPGVPARFAPRAVAVDGELRLRGGPFDGLSVRVEEREGLPHLVFGDTVSLPPWSSEPDVTRFVPGLPGPPVAVDPAVEPAYRALLAEVWVAAGGVVRPPDGVSVSGWLRWVADEQVVLFHGTGDGAIEEFVPQRLSYELRDEAGRGNRGAVYATDDAWWALWFAVIDRDRLRGSMRNGVEDFTDPDGHRLPVYYFSLDHRVLPSRPWRDGWLYLLPRERFDRLGVTPAGPPSHEWCRRTAVVPLARLAVTPADFPFLDQVAGHDDGPLFRLDELGDLVTERITTGWRIPGGVELRLRWDDTLAAVAEEYLQLSHRWIPEVHRELHHDSDGQVRLTLTAPAELAAMLQTRYADFIAGP
jgi:hypothetical protein